MSGQARELLLRAEYSADHCPVLLKTDSLDFGPPPFRFFDHCLTKEGFGKIIRDVWERDSSSGIADVVLKKKLKAVKVSTKDWR